MRITLLAPVADFSGGARVISIYARELDRRGHDVRVIVAQGPVPGWRDRLRRLRHGQLTTRIERKPSHYDTIDHLVVRLPRPGPIEAADCPDADIVIATWWETAEWMMRLPAAKGRKMHFVQGYEAFDTMPKERVHAVLRLPTRKITISRWLEDLLRGSFGNDDVHLVANGVDMTQFDAPPRARSAVPTVGMLYHTAPFKNVAGGIAAFEILRARMPQARLLTFGTSEEVADIPLPDAAVHHQLPAQSRIRDIYTACDVWLCPSENEGFGLPPLEAMACRCPVISTPVGGPLEFIDDGTNGYIVPFHDVDAMGRKLIELFEMDAAAWQTLSERAYDTACARKWDYSVDRFEQALTA